MRASGLFKAAAIGLLLAGCDPRLLNDGEVTRDDGSILYMPKMQPSIHADGRVYPFPHRIVDDETGYVLTKSDLRKLAGHDDTFTEWKLDRSKAHKPDVIFVTRNRTDRVPGTPPWAETMEIAYAKTDGFLPLKEALYPADLPFKRIAGMINIYGLKEGSHARMYLDNRLPNRARYEQWARERMRLDFMRPNFEPYNTLTVPGVRLYRPKPGSARYDPVTQTAVAADGSRLHSDNSRWSIYRDRDGRLYRMYATWTDPTGTKQVRITMLALRGYQKGYGETRAVEVIIDGTPPSPGVDPETPDGESLANLINVLVPIAGEHAGHMIVVDERAYHDPWR